MNAQTFQTMKTKHTPGPWHVAETLNTQHTPVHTLVKTAFGGHVAACFYGSHDEERVANARLIAAAPDLLAAVLQIEDEINRTGSPSAEGWDNARKAIAKAKGTQ